MKENKYFTNLPESGEASGTYKALWAYRHSLSMKLDELELTDFLWKNEVRDFVRALRKAEIKSFIITNHSTGLMEMMHLLSENGCVLTGLANVPRPETPFSDEENVKGIRFTLN